MTPDFRRFGVPRVAICLVTVFWALAWAGHGVARNDLDFCARPVPPECAETLTDRSPRSDIETCQKDVDRYVKMTFTFRRCLARQLENEIRRTNAILDRFRCISAGKNTGRGCDQFE